MDTITVRTPATLGCTVASTALFQGLRSAFPDAQIIVYTATPDLFAGLPDVDAVVDVKSAEELSRYDVDLKDYLVYYREPICLKPYRHLTDHMFDIAQAQLHVRLPHRAFEPKIYLAEEERAWAKLESSVLSNGKQLIWLQTRSGNTVSGLNKELSPDIWKEVVRRASDDYQFMDLAGSSYTRRQSIALTACSSAGITLDSFLMHGAKAVGAKKTVAVCVATPSQVVSYPDQFAIDGSERPSPITADEILSALAYINAQ